MNDWTKAAITAGLGVLAGIITQTLLPFITRYIESRQLERTLYIEILNNYLGLIGVLQSIEGNKLTRADVVSNLRTHVRTNALEYGRQHPFVFYLIKPYPTIDAIYSRMRFLFNIVDAGGDIPDLTPTMHDLVQLID